MTERELENLFKSKLEKHEVPYEPSSWAAMEQLLNQRQAIPLWKQGWVRITALATTGIAAGVAALALLTSSPDSPATALPEALPATSITAEPSTSPAASTTLGVPPAAAGGNQENAVETLAASPASSTAGNASSGSVSNSAARTATAAAWNRPSEVANLPTSLADENATPAEATSSFAAERVELPLRSPFETDHGPTNGWTIERASKSPAFTFRSPFEVSLIAGLNIAQAYQNNGVDQMQDGAAAYFAGLQVRFGLKNNWNLISGLQYSQRGALNAKRTFDTYTYNFGVEHTHTQVTSQTLHVLELPVGVQLQLGTRHLLDGGAYASYLLAANNRVETTVRHQFAPEGVHSTSTSLGYESAFSRWDYGLYGGYAFRFSPVLAAGFRAQYGLQDITANELFHRNHTDRNLQLRIFLTYSLL